MDRRSGSEIAAGEPGHAYDTGRGVQGQVPGADGRIRPRAARQACRRTTLPSRMSGAPAIRAV